MGSGDTRHEPSPGARPAPTDRGAPQPGTTPGLLVVLLLSALAGAVDAYGVAVLKDLFVSFMSGNTTMMGIALAGSDGTRAARIGALIALFVAGAAGGTVIATLAGRHQLPVVVTAVAALLAAAVAVTPVAPFGMALAMGLLNAAMKRAGSVSVSITYVTGTLVHLGQGLGDRLCGRDVGWAWLLQAVPWLGILAGAAAAARVLHAYGIATMAGLPVAALLVAAIILAIERLARLDRIVVAE